MSMTPLEEMLQTRCARSPRWRFALSGGACGSRLIKRLIWPRRYKHMRFLEPGISLSSGPDLRWTICRNGQPLVTSTPLRDLIPPVNQPVSIVATGPSALDYPWDRSGNGKLLIAVNGAPTMLRDLGLKPDLMVVTDREFCLTGKRHFEAAPGVPLAIEYLAAAALASTAPEWLLDRPIAILERVNLWHALPALDEAKLRLLNEISGAPFVFPETRDPKCRIGWSHRPELGIFSGRTVVFAALQIAIGLGATDVEIIGMDLGASGRSYAEGAGQRPTQLQVHYEEFILPSFRIMSQTLTGSDVSVRNISPVCPLPAEYFAANRDITQT